MHKTVGKKFFVALMVAAALWGATTTPARAESQKAKAKALFLRGVDAFRAQNYAVALVLFQKSYRLHEASVVLYNMAMCHRALFQYTQSIDVFKKYIAKKGAKLRSSEKRKIEKFIREMEAKLARIVLAVEPAGARILLDGRFVGTSPLKNPINADPGAHVLEVTKDGYRSERRQLQLLDGQQTSVALILKREGSGMGTLVLSSPAKGAVAVVDRGAPVSLPLTLPLAAGAHSVTVTAPGHKPKAFVVVIQPHAVEKQQVILEMIAGSSGSVTTSPGQGEPKARHDADARQPADRKTPADVTSPRVARAAARTVVSPKKNEGTAGLGSSEPKEKKKSQVTPWYKTWWFWTSVGVAVVAGAAVGGYFGYAASQDNGNDTVDADVVVHLR